MRVLLFIVLLGMLGGCGRSQHIINRDVKVLCEPTKLEAYYIEPSFGDSSFVRREPVMDPLCRPNAPR